MNLANDNSREAVSDQSFWSLGLVAWSGLGLIFFLPWPWQLVIAFWKGSLAVNQSFWEDKREAERRGMRLSQRQPADPTGPLMGMSVSVPAQQSCGVCLVTLGQLEQRVAVVATEAQALMRPKRNTASNILKRHSQFVSEKPGNAFSGSACCFQPWVLPVSLASSWAQVTRPAQIALLGLQHSRS